jgi:hypothetical protein
MRPSLITCLPKVEDNMAIAFNSFDFMPGKLQIWQGLKTEGQQHNFISKLVL